ncbi:MAG: hypothetical protein A2857_06050 [Candidatus Levybacteria bacterium RIFCSPHIGHO2_01_FULL_36_15]|nr:MAG: hypothetical protein A2857_06050 [Candidatus Levybacteria bacterium RIFCSPHIGHO2_01_FULL_36_15]OGH37548.1 MAG: hypothetical protein A2905_01255 [Candidatus Levybacteria bacterium RIFCSPLOWO2_01_FULL_36_10]
MSKNNILRTTLFLILLIFIPVTVSGIFSIYNNSFRPGSAINPATNFSNTASFKKFLSDEDFKAYIKAGLESISGGGMMNLAVPSLGRGAVEVPRPEVGIPDLKSSEGQTDLAAPSLQRTSETNVQVLGIDEPDIVKTDGNQIYFSSNNYYLSPMPIARPMMGVSLEESRSIMPYPYINKLQTKIIKAFPVQDLSKIADINQNGNLLLSNNILIILTNDAVIGYDVTNIASPSQKWKMDFKDNNYLLQARLYKQKLFLVVRQSINIGNPCPIQPLGGSLPVTIRCTDIYHPSVSVPVDSTYTAMVINPVNGEVDRKVSFVGSNNSSVVYMSENSLYVTYSFSGDYVNFYYQFLDEKGRDLLPQSYLEKISRLKDYDISKQAKMVELETILSEYQSFLSSDERLRVENEFSNRMKDFLSTHKRDLEKTGIVKIGLVDLAVLSTGQIPGTPLNQFSLDEYLGNLRVATTVSGNSFGSSESTNDVYVLDSNLTVLGLVKDLGQKERIYSVRFLKDRGYLVTFRQTDPFFVLDLSNPSMPQVKGELKIPGYSSYLHPISADKIVGFGKEGAQLKISLFDVSSPSSPEELAKYNLDEYSSDVLETHHAFLQDQKHSVFFIPGTKGAYVFSYEGNKLKLVRAVTDIQARRALYINDYMYIVGDDKIVVLQESDWSRAKELSFQ